MIITNRQVLQDLIDQFNGPKSAVAAEIIATFETTLGKWADRPFTQRVRKAKPA